MFKFALEAEGPLSLMTYSFLDEEGLEAVVVAPLSPLTTHEILSRQDDMRRRLNGRCKGLLEVVNGAVSGFGPGTYIYQFHAPKVEFHHRTVRDFLHTKDMQNMLAENVERGFEPKLRLCEAFLAQLKALDYRALKDGAGGNQLPGQLLDDLAYYASRLENENHIAQFHLLDEAGRCLSKQAGIRGSRDAEKDFLKLLVRQTLHLYIDERLTTSMSLTKSDKSMLLGIALESWLMEISIVEYNPKMIDVLLKHGAQPNNNYENSTVWGCFLRSALTSQLPITEEFLSIIESLLSRGAKLEQIFFTGQRVQSTTSGKHNPPKRQEYQVEVAKSARNILLELLGEGKLSELLRKVRQNRKSIPSRSKGPPGAIKRQGWSPNSPPALPS